MHIDERVAGADLVPAIAELAARKGYSIFLLGAGPQIAARAGAILQERYPGLKIVGAVSPPYGSVFEIDTGILEEIKAARPDFLLVAFGNPKQEKWIDKHKSELKVKVCIGIGGSLDVFAGTVKLAPEFYRKHGLEWFYRLCKEPWRYKRMLDLPRFILRILAIKLHLRKNA
jgi:N-acetylglucosaminyldiphosphoundecaprenol N-acetyl-beta-D-mannosaminyltransferase